MGCGMAERDNKKSLKQRAAEALQTVVDALQALLPEPTPQLIPVRVRSAPRHPRARR
jgi:hypothetical protein